MSSSEWCQSSGVALGGWRTNVRKSGFLAGSMSGIPLVMMSGCRAGSFSIGLVSTTVTGAAAGASHGAVEGVAGRAAGAVLVSDESSAINDSYTFFRQRASTALRAMAERLAAESARARANPPLDAPSFDRATAAGFLVSGGSGGASGTCPVASCTIW